MSTRTIDLIYFNAGGGHRASALALEAALRLQAPAWRVRRVNLFEVLDPQDRFRALTGSGPEDWYNKRLARGWTLGMTQELKLLQAAIRLGHPLLVRQLQQHWLRTEPDLVVSLVPNFNRALYQSLASVLPGVPYVTQLILICGHNRALAARLRRLPRVAPRLVVEFTADIPYYMRLADFFIGKPGPGSLSEAVHQGLPVIVVDNAWTMPQERYNAEWVRDNGLGVVHGSFRSIDRAVAQLLAGLDEFRAGVGRIDNRALFEVPEILARILQQGSEVARGALPDTACRA